MKNSDLFNAGYTEDGEMYTAERYHIQAEHKDGARWLYPVYFDGCERKEIHDEEFTGVIFEDWRAEAKEIATDILIELAMADSLELEKWESVAPAYGS